MTKTADAVDDTGVIRGDRRGNVQWIWLNRPLVRNALNAER